MVTFMREQVSEILNRDEEKHTIILSRISTEFKIVFITLGPKSY